ncbi:MAG TPA: TraR/DksA family transcriptional regulator [Polyangia bacterium]|jgi:DnaK suppressor protein|nr:TraR/DksA family transcriptional regulator [Polyangia bacterium]
MARAEPRDKAGLTRAQRDTLRARLDRARRAAIAELKEGETAARAAENEPEPMDAAELAREQGDGALLIARARAQLQEIDAALERMRAGTYGVSERSGDPIGYERLEAVPWARLGADESEGR